MAQFTLGSRSTTKLKRITARMQKGTSGFYIKSLYRDRDVLRMIEIDIDIYKDIYMEIDMDIEIDIDMEINISVYNTIF